MAKSLGLFAPDGSQYVTLTDGNNNVVTPFATTYVAGRYYTPKDSTTALGSGSAPGANSIRLFPGLITNTITVNQIFLRMTTVAAAGNTQAAFYAASPTTSLPTGAALASTASMPTDAGTSLTGTINYQFKPGLYWFATNSDNATVAFIGVGANNVDIMNHSIGSTQPFDMLEAVAGGGGLTVSQTFGTWPDLTSGSFTWVHSGIPMMAFRVASSP